jgi:hypothetical protein
MMKVNAAPARESRRAPRRISGHSHSPLSTPPEPLKLKLFGELLVLLILLLLLALLVLLVLLVLLGNGTAARPGPGANGTAARPGIICCIS